MKNAPEVLLARGRRAEIVRVADEHDRTRILKRVTGGLDRARVAAEMEREFELLRTLGARGLVACLGLESDGETFALHFEDVHATSLDLRPGQFTADEVRRIALDVTRTLADLHAEDVLHLAIDPSHVLVASGGQAYVVGLGSACAYARVSAPRTVTPARSAFIAPELGGTIPMRVDARTDLYALGATIAWMLGPSTETSDDACALRALALRLTAEHPDARPESAERVLAHLRGEPLTDRPARLGPAFGPLRTRLVLFEGDEEAFAAETAHLALHHGALARLHAGSVDRRRVESGLGDPDGTLGRLDRATAEPTLVALDAVDPTDDRVLRAIEKRLRAPFGGPFELWVARTPGDDVQVARLVRAFATRGMVERVAGTRRPADTDSLDEDATTLLTMLVAADTDVEIAMLDEVSGLDASRLVRALTRKGLVLPRLGSRRVMATHAGRAFVRESLGEDALPQHARVLVHAMERGEPRAHRLARVAVTARHALSTPQERQHATMLLVDAIETTTLGESYTACAGFGIALLDLLDGDERRTAKTSVRRALAEAARAAVESGHSALMERLLAALAAIAREPVDIGEVHALRAIAAFRREDEVTALVEAHAAGKALGIDIPVSATPLRTGLEITALVPTLVPREGKLYVALSTTEGLENVLVHDVLHAALEHARRLPPALASTLAATTLRESLARGASPATVLALAHVALTVLDRAPLVARAAAEAAFALSRRFRDVQARARATIARELASTSEDAEGRTSRIRRARDEAIREGLDVVAVDATVAAARVLARAGAPLSVLGTELRDGARALGKLDPSIAALLQTVENLTNDDDHAPWIHHGPTFEEGSIVEALEHGDRTTAARAIAAQLVLAGLFERVETVERLTSALALLGEDERAARDVPGFALQTSLAALTAPRPIVPTTGKLVSLLADAMLDVRKRGAARLGIAEWLDRLGLEETALDIREALVHENVETTATMERAVFAERLARAHGKRGDAARSADALREAHALYLEAGVRAKARALEAQHPFLRIS